MGSGGKKSEDVEEQDGLDEGVVGQGKKVVGGGNGGLDWGGGGEFSKCMKLDQSCGIRLSGCKNWMEMNQLKNLSEINMMMWSSWATFFALSIWSLFVSLWWFHAYNLLVQSQCNMDAIVKFNMDHLMERII